MRLRVISLVIVLSAISNAQTSTISACFNTTNGQMRFVTSSAACRGGENLVTWNTQGPKGDKGDTGDPGPAGPPGPSGGASDIYTTQAFGGDTATELTRYAHLDLPAGGYMINAVVDAAASPLDYVHCLVTAFGDHGNFQEKDLVSPGYPPPGFQLNGSLVFQFEAESVTEANVSCMSPFTDGGQVGRVSLRAVPVGAIHVQ